MSMGVTIQMTLEGQIYYDSHCKWCGKPYNKKYHTQKYCSEKCRQKALHKQKTWYDKYCRKKPEHTIAVCKYCGETFEKSHESEVYCCDKCREHAILESAAKYQRKRRRSINNGELVSNEYRYVGTNYLSQHRREDFDEEQKAIQKEMKRLKLR